MKNRLAIYDLDRTITLRGTYTAFLLFAAWRKAPLRLLFAPLFVLVLASHPLGLATRKTVKEIGFRLFIGAGIDDAAMDDLATAYAALTINQNISKTVARQIADDRQTGCKLVLATAAPDYYAQRLGERLGFDAVIATRQARDADGRYSYRIGSKNCYGEEKLTRIRAWLKEAAIARNRAEIRFYTDHISDLPVLRWADAAIAVKPGRTLASLAQRSGWRILEHA